MSVKIINFGCRLNIYEGEVIRKNSEAAGLNDCVIINSCAVTQEAEKKLKKAIKKAKKDHPSSKIVVTGCAAQLHGDDYSSMNEVDYVLGNSEKLKKESYLKMSTEPILVNDIMSIKETAGHMVDGIEDKTRAFLQIQNGCNHRCTFCIIPYARGNNRSVPLGDIVKSARLLIDQGYKEIVLTGVDITDYGKDIPGEPSLGSMISRLLQLLPDLKRLRLSSIDVAEVDEKLFQLIVEEKRVMPHIHLSLQSGDNMILKRMKRRHNREQVYDFCNTVLEKRPEVVFGADIIAGFPTETEEMFLNSYNLVKDLNIVHLHIFPYSIREGTPAARMPQVKGDVIKERAKKLKELQKSLEQCFLRDRVGTVKNVLVESNNKGFTEDYFPVLIRNKRVEKGDIVSLKMLKTEQSFLIA